MKLLKNSFFAVILSSLLPYLMALPASVLEEESLHNIRLFTKADKHTDFDYDLAVTEVAGYGNEPLTDEIEERPYKLVMKGNVESLTPTKQPVYFLDDDYAAFPRFCAFALLSLGILFLMCFKLYKIKRTEEQRFQYRMDCAPNIQELKPLAEFAGNFTEDEDTIFEIEEYIKTKALKV